MSHSFKKLQFLLNHRIQFEVKKKTIITQCFNCQRFGHSSSNCNLTARCVKCPGMHHTSECTISKETQKNIVLENGITQFERNVTCINCGERHTANYKQCPHYVALLQKMRAKRGLAAENRQFKRKSHANYVTGVSYANMTRFSQPQQHQQQQQHQHDKSRVTQTNASALSAGISAPASSSSNVLTFLSAESESMFGISFCHLMSKMSEIKRFAEHYKTLNGVGAKSLAMIEFVASIGQNV